jgi:hypothetical protein
LPLWLRPHDRNWHTPALPTSEVGASVDEGAGDQQFAACVSHQLGPQVTSSEARPNPRWRDLVPKVRQVVGVHLLACHQNGPLARVAVLKCGVTCSRHLSEVWRTQVTLQDRGRAMLPTEMPVEEPTTFQSIHQQQDRECARPHPPAEVPRPDRRQVAP